mmetsp:Transcript_103521/g.179805  ORF Transcript_103521/g.179805 Transcript_103521/m.179805 type:complete len:119 (+) Transcript_103521:78-434(+)
MGLRCAVQCTENLNYFQAKLLEAVGARSRRSPLHKRSAHMQLVASKACSIQKSFVNHRSLQGLVAKIYLVIPMMVISAEVFLPVEQLRDRSTLRHPSIRRSCTPHLLAKILRGEQHLF